MAQRSFWEACKVLGGIRKSPGWTPMQYCINDDIFSLYHMLKAFPGMESTSIMFPSFLSSHTVRALIVSFKSIPDLHLNIFFWGNLSRQINFNGYLALSIFFRLLWQGEFSLELGNRQLNRTYSNLCWTLPHGSPARWSKTHQHT